MKISTFLTLLCLIFPALVAAQTAQISENITLRFDVPAGWEQATEPPQVLLEEMAEHIAHDAAEKGYSPDRNQLLDAARKRLADNEVLLYNPNSKSHLTLDFSRLRQGERPPSLKTIQLSAKYAGESLSQEEGVSNLVGNNRNTTIIGADNAYRYDADYLHHGEKMHFSGVIGFSSPYWFFFYYTDYLSDPEDKNRADQVLESIKIEKK